MTGDRAGDDPCRSITGQERQYHCTLQEGHPPPCVWKNHAPERGTEPGFYDHPDDRAGSLTTREDSHAEPR